ncbi:MAG: hypothetical protein PVJ21_05125, partial [Anaerolineales bacterium]
TAAGSIAGHFHLGWRSVQCLPAWLEVYSFFLFSSTPSFWDDTYEFILIKSAEDFIGNIGVSYPTM